MDCSLCCDETGAPGFSQSLRSAEAGDVVAWNRLNKSPKIGAGMQESAERPDVDAIRHHYDFLQPFYRSLWGEHIHHGYWEADESPAEAQIKLIRKLVTFAAVPRGARVLDVGCGMGGSSLWLAQEMGCEVTGITISTKQAEAAAVEARQRGLADRVRFDVQDANDLDFPDQSFDAVWVIEASEHLADKRQFIRGCSRILAPDGVLAMCAWVKADKIRQGEHARLVRKVCQGMLCPSLASLPEYSTWMRKAGLHEVFTRDIVQHVRKTWELCAKIARRPEVRLALKTADQRPRDFVESFASLQRAFDEGAMGYGMMRGRKAGKAGG